MSQQTDRPTPGDWGRAIRYNIPEPFAAELRQWMGDDPITISDAARWLRRLADLLERPDDEPD